MIMINVDCQVDPAKKDAFESFVQDLVNKSKQDKGNLFYGYFVDQNDPNHYLIVENWRDQAAVNAHNQTDHLQNFLHTANDYLSQDFTLKVGYTKVDKFSGD